MALATEYTVAKSGIVHRFWAVAATMVANARRRAAYDNTVRALNSLSDSQLRDLGLHRSEIARVARQATH